MYISESSHAYNSLSDCLHVAPKGPPPGAVAVFPPGGVPLFNSTKEG